jgi:hypothetical protein
MHDWYPFPAPPGQGIISIFMRNGQRHHLRGTPSYHILFMPGENNLNFVITMDCEKGRPRAGSAWCSKKKIVYTPSA